MEINIDNAFNIAVKWTCGPCLAKYQGFAEGICQFIHVLINYFLRKPLLTTFICSIFLILTMLSLFIALLALFGVCCFVIAILLVESFLVITIISVIIIVISNLILIMAVVYEIKDSINADRVNVIN